MTFDFSFLDGTAPVHVPKVRGSVTYTPLVKTATKLDRRLSEVHVRKILHSGVGMPQALLVENLMTRTPTFKMSMVTRLLERCHLPEPQKKAKVIVDCYMRAGIVTKPEGRTSQCYSWHSQSIAN